MHSLVKTAWRGLLPFAGLTLFSCSHANPTGSTSSGSGSGPSSSGPGTSSAVASGTTQGTTTAGIGTASESNGATVGGTSTDGSTTSASTGAGGTGGVVSTVVPGAEGFDCTPSDGSTPSLALTEVASGLYEPLGVYFAPGNPSRGYVILAEGQIRVFDGSGVLETPFLDISDRIEREQELYEERGLLGMAFHPDFQQNGKFYLSYTSGGFENGNCQNVISEFTANGDTADAGSENVLLTVPQPNNNHNGGALAIGLDSNLYISIGDGGFENLPSADEHNNGQNPATLLSTILRIGLDGSIPAGNMAGAAPEVWDIGVRNAWRISFDGCTGDFYIADVGFEGELASSEEVNVEPPLMGGKNYGWPIMEGDSCREEGCDMTPFVLPTDFYGWQAGSAVIGGYVYRGSAIPGLRGTYVYGDFASGEFRALDYAGGIGGSSRDLNVAGADAVRAIVSFGQDPSGEMYVVTWSGEADEIFTQGEVYRIGPG